MVAQMGAICAIVSCLGWFVKASFNLHSCLLCPTRDRSLSIYDHRAQSVTIEIALKIKRISTVPARLPAHAREPLRERAPLRGGQPDWHDLMHQRRVEDHDPVGHGR